MERLHNAIERLSAGLMTMNIDVCVPLYANTFPLATVAKIAAEKARKRGGDTIAINSFDWNWSKDPESPPPFVTSRPHQLFFATASEFSRIHAAGISFCAIPVSVFHPRYIFIGLPRMKEDGGSDVNKYRTLAELIEKGLSTKSVSRPDGGSEINAFRFIWVSDIPDQAEILARYVSKFLGKEEPHERLTNFWMDRPLGDVLIPLPYSDPSLIQLKMFVWSGPLSSVMRADSESIADNQSQTRRHPLLLRDRRLDRLVIELPSLIKAFTNEQIKDRHALYCCIGYKEDRNLEDYYTSGKYLKDVAPWDLNSLKFKAMQSTPLGDLASNLSEFFKALFAGVASATSFAPESHFNSFVSDFDKFCRTLNPIAQLHTPEIYAECLRVHHDAEAFASLFP